ncbi:MULTISPECIES: hypothetical protein [Filomicrobium]|nr:MULTISPECIES: hypothetical protein [Filomicrobium]
MQDVRPKSYWQGAILIAAATKFTNRMIEPDVLVAAAGTLPLGQH